MTHGPRRWRLGRSLAAVATACIVGLVGANPSSAAVVGSSRAGARINGTGSTYVGLAMQQWTAEAQVQGLQVNYTPTGSPDGLSRFKGGQVDFAGTEAEFASLLVGGQDVSRGFQYVPDVGGAVAVMYNVEDLAGRKVDYLHLSRRTVAKIFMGYISRWNDPAIAADNKAANLRLPDQPINVVYRAGQSGTTALFYDFVREMEPSLYRDWIRRNRLPDGRIIALDTSPDFAPRTQALSGSDQIAQFLAGRQGRWSISYDEFGYAKTYRASSAWIDNSGGKWTLPYAENISAALERARLRPDLSQELSGVYTNPNPLTYPISAYSYVVTQCKTSSDRPTCKGPYANPGVAETLSKWMRYIACDGQIRMAEIGYSPLPPNLSQEIANSIGRMIGSRADTLSRGNCANPRFRGSLGAGFRGPTDPYLGLPGGGGSNQQGGGSGGNGSGGAGTGGGTGSGGTGGDPSAGAGGTGTGPGGSGSGANGTGAESATTGSEEAAAGKAGSEQAIGGGSGEWRQPDPTAYRTGVADDTTWPLVVLLAVIATPVIATTVVRRGRGRRTGAPRPG